MTFQEAVETKTEFKSEFLYKDIPMKVFITPEKEEDFQAFLMAYVGNGNLTDEHAKLYSSNKKFTVCAFSRVWWPNGLYLQLYKLREINQGR